MAFRALLFSKSLDTNAALTAACQNAGIRLEICDDIFSAIEKGTHQPFSCVLADWSEQPEAGFLLKRARESAPNVNAVAIAIVTHEPTAANMRENRLDFFISRPIVAEQAQEVLVKAAEGMQEVSIADLPEIRTPAPRPDIVRSAPAAVPPAQNPERNQWHNPAEPVQTSTVYDGGMDVTEDSAAITRQQHRNHSSGSSFSWRGAAAAVLALVAIFCLWTARGTIQYLARTSESRANVFKEAAEALFSPNVPAATPAPSDAAIDAYVNRSESKSEGHVQLGVVSTEAEVDNSQLRKPSELPLPAPVYEHPAATPIEAPRTSIPESLRSSASMPPPVVVTTTPAQMMPVSAPAVAPFSTQQFSEPVGVTEEVERSLLVRSVTPAFPQEAAAQKMHGAVVLQATIARDGTVEDLKIVRGSFVLSKAAIAAVKQWQFQPYVINGRPVETQTFITVNFNAPTN
ncbi:MAG: TonB family protein [Terriglobales bacterium]|jgi:TonB family protein